MADVAFHGFKTRSVPDCKNDVQAVFGLHDSAADHIGMQFFSGVVFDDVTNDAVAYIRSPPGKWATIDDCGEFPCTGPQNVVMKFKKVTCTGTEKPGFCGETEADFTVVSTRKGDSTAYDGCTLNAAWNAFLCTGANKDKIGQLIFESLDSDTLDRSVQPVDVIATPKGYRNILNSMMDHVWDGFYTGQTRLSRFPVQIENDKDYNVLFTGTPPGKMRFLLKEGIEGKGIFLRIRYADSGAYQVTVGGKVEPFNEWNADIGQYAPVRKTHCGENRYVGQKNFMEFYITPGCEVTIVPKKAVMGNVRMQQTLTSFYSDGGTSKFSDRISSALGIHASRVKVVAVYEGSVVVEYSIEADEEATESAQLTQVTQLSKTLTNLFTSGSAAAILGAPVLSADISASIGSAGSGGSSGLELVPQAASTSTTAAALTDTISNTQKEIGIGETILATATLLAPMLYAMTKKPEVVEQLQELYEVNFLGEGRKR